MENKTPVSLSQQFSQLEFVKKANGWLRSIKGKELSIQLKERRITGVFVKPIVSDGVLEIEKDNNFSIILDSYGFMENIEKNAYRLGYEIACTFRFDLTKNPPLKITIADISSELGELIESFYNEFSVKWLAANGKKNVELYCMGLEK